MLVILGLRLVANHKEQAKWDQLIAAIRQTGEPILFANLRFPPVDPEDNKSVHLRRAINDWPRINDGTQLISDTDWFGYHEPDQPPTDPITDPAAYLSRCEPIKLHLLAAENAPHANNNAKPVRHNVIHHLIPGLTEDRQLARLVDDTASRHQQESNLAQTLTWTRLISTTGDNRLAPPHSLIGNLVGISIDAMMISRIQSLLVDPDLNWKPLNGQAEGTAREPSQQLIHRLIDEPRHRALLEQTWIGERWCSHDVSDGILNDAISYKDYGLDDQPPNALEKGQAWLLPPISTPRIPAHP